MTGNNKIRVTYDPYQQEIRCEYMSAAGTTWETLQAGGKLAAMFSDGKRQGSLQNCAHDIVEGIKHDFCTTGQGVDLFFCGTEEDWEDLKKVVEQDAGSKIICVGSAGQLECAKDVLPKIKDIFQNLSNDFEGLTENDEVKKPIDQFLTTVKPDVVLYVSGTYSTGKSTFINALIGEELLPSAIDPTTAHIFRIESLPEGNWVNTKIHFQYLNKDVVITFGKEGYVLEDPNLLPDLELKNCLDQILEGVTPGPVYIKTVLELINNFNSLKAPESKEQETKKWISPQIEVSTPFYNSTLPLNDFRSLIYDTPGTNAANHRDHLAVMQDSLKEQTNGLPILLVTPTQTDATEVEELRNEIHKIGGALDESNILVVVTQADKETFAGLKKAHQNQRKAAFKNAGKRICYTSAAMGFYSKTGRYPTMGIESEEDQEENLEKLESNSTPYKNGRTRLYTIDSLPHNQMETICEKGNLANETGTEKEKMLHNSGLWAIEREIERFARRFAAYNKCWQAQVYLSQAIDTVKQIQEKNHQQIAKDQEEMKSLFDEQKKILIDEIEKKSTAWFDDNWKGYRKKQSTRIETVLSRIETEVSSEVIRERWKEAKKQNDNKESAIHSITAWINDYLDGYIKKVTAKSHQDATSFWIERINQYKYQCIQIVNESSSLTAEEKNFLKQYIWEVRAPILEKVKFIMEPTVYQNRFLFIRWIDVKPDQCAIQMISELKRSIRETNQNFAGEIKETIKKWSSKFKADLKQNIVEFNPTLLELREEIARYYAQIEILESAQLRMEKTQNELTNLFHFHSNVGGAV